MVRHPLKLPGMEGHGGARGAQERGAVWSLVPVQGAAGGAG